jgi:hypothetical protein
MIVKGVDWAQSSPIVIIAGIRNQEYWSQSEKFENGTFPEGNPVQLLMISHLLVRYSVLQNAQTKTVSEQIKGLTLGPLWCH